MFDGNRSGFNLFYEGTISLRLAAIIQSSTDAATGFRPNVTLPDPIRDMMTARHEDVNGVPHPLPDLHRSIWVAYNRAS